MSFQRQVLGSDAETIVARRLEHVGFEIRGRNVRVGRLEIDLIAQRGSLLVFCEVRSRSHERQGGPWETVDWRKLGKVKRAAARWLREARQEGQLRDIRAVRIDVASVVFDAPSPRVSYFPDVTAWR
jgi:putative endonuclease